MDTKFIFLTSLFLGFILALNFLSASVGCCVNTEQGGCSSQADSSGCTSDLGGNFFSSGCAGLSECKSGCCVLGTTAGIMTKVQCVKQSASNGIQTMNFQEGMSVEECTKLQSSQNLGSCIVGTDVEPLCSVTTVSQCSGTFNEGGNCLETTTSCKDTDKTICYGGNVYSVTTCGTPGKKKATCDYINDRTKCKQIDVNTAECKSIDCTTDGPDGDLLEGSDKKNGDIWCIGPLTWAYRGPDAEIKVVDAPIPGNYVTNIPQSAKIYAGTDFHQMICNEGKVQATACNQGVGGRQNYCWGHSSKGAGSDSKSEDSPPETETPPITAEVIKNFITGKAGETPDTTTTEIMQAGTCSCLDITLYDRGNPDPDPNICNNGYRCDVNPNCGSVLTSNNCNDCCYSSTSVAIPDAPILAEVSPPVKTGGKCAKNKGNSCFGIEDSETCNKNPACYWLEASVLTKYYGFGECTQESCGWSACSYPRRASSAIKWVELNINADDKLVFPGLTQCMPKIPAGGEFITAEKTGETTAASCDYGKFEVNDLLYLTDRGSTLDLCYWTEYEENICKDYRSETQKRKCEIMTYPNELVGQPMSWNPNIWALLEEKTKALGDCAGKKNMNKQNGNENVPVMPEKLTLDGVQGGNQDELGGIISSAKREISPIWLPPTSSSSCSRQCAPPLCSQYECKSLGLNCEFKDGVEQKDGSIVAVCIDNSDKSPPQITSSSLNPKGIIPPFSAVGINIAVNENAHCKFEIGSENSGKKYADISDANSFGKGFSKEQSIVLNVPGRLPASVPDAPEYSLLTRDGKYQLFVKCADIAGNANEAAYLIEFEVDKNPDMLPPVILNITPADGSAVKFNATTQNVNLTLDYPAECKWSFIDEDYDTMTHNLSCQREYSVEGMKNGYPCTGILTNVTLDLQSETKYYFRCKDQPELQGYETDIYKRNKNTESKEYKLRASEELKIDSLSPQGSFTVGSAIGFEIEAVTTGGCCSGIARCEWSLTGGESSGAFNPFNKESSNIHQQQITTLFGNGDYSIAIKCTDNSGNEASGNSSFKINIDTTAPVAVRIYNKNNQLRVITDEKAVCYYSSDKAKKCDFEINNGTKMAGDSTEHYADWKPDTNYFIRCKDNYNNYNDCTSSIRTY